MCYDLIADYFPDMVGAIHLTTEKRRCIQIVILDYSMSMYDNVFGLSRMRVVRMPSCSQMHGGQHYLCFLITAAATL